MVIVWLPILWISAGVCLFAGVHFTHVGRLRAQGPMYVIFGTFCLFVSAFLAVSALMQTPDLRIDPKGLERVMVVLLCLCYPAAVTFLSLYTRLRVWRPWVIGSYVVFAALLVLEFVSPHSLIVSSLTGQAPLILPWGERVRQFGTHSSVYAPIYYACTLIVFVWAFWRCGALWRSGDRRRALPLAIYLCLQLTSVMYSEYATLYGLNALDWGALPFLVLVVLLSRTLTLEMRRYAVQLGDSVRALREENAARTQAQSHLHHMARHDALTDLPNREALRERIDASGNAGDEGQGALVVIDPERFKVINQALGHHVGDEIMLEIGRRLAENNDNRSYVARLDGDEFAVLLSGLSDDREAAELHARSLAESIRQELAARMRLDAHEFSIDTSAGVTLFSSANSKDSSTLLREGYMALNAAKASSRHHVTVFAQQMQTDAERRLKLEHDLRLAIENRVLYLQYQPQLDVQGMLVGAEALLRWEHAELGTICPQEFVRIAEESGQIHQLGQYALREACLALAGLPVGNSPFRMAVNISPLQLFLPDFLDTVHETVRLAGANPERLTLEITESAFVHDVSDAIRKSHALNASGIRVAIDDFGTGYASVAALKALPVSELKIDQSFIRDMRITPPDRFVGAMVNLGRALDLHVVAEGVETEDQRAALAHMGCDVFQGYLISRPVAARKLQDWMPGVSHACEDQVP